MKEWRKFAIVVLALQAGADVACGSGKGSSPTTSMDAGSYVTYSSSAGSSSSSSSYTVPMNFLDGMVIVTYPDGSQPAQTDAEADANADGD